MELRETLNQALERLLASGRVEVQENGSWISAREGFQYEVREKAGAIVLHLWSQEGTLVRRVIGIEAHDDEHLTLEVKRFGRTRSERLELLCGERKPDAGHLRREQFRAPFSEMLAQQFPDESISSLAASADLEHSLSGSYVRGITTAKGHAMAVMAAAPDETAATYDALLTFGLLWLDHARHRKSRQQIGGLRLFFPEGSGTIIAHRLKAFSASTMVELFEYDPAARRARQLDPQDAGNVKSWLTPRREIEAVMAQARGAIEPICRLNPAAISAEVISGTNEVALRFRGVLFARSGPAGTFFGIDSQRAAHARPAAGTGRSGAHTRRPAQCPGHFARASSVSGTSRALAGVIGHRRRRADRRPHRSAFSLCSSAGNFSRGSWSYGSGGCYAQRAACRDGTQGQRRRAPRDAGD